MLKDEKERFAIKFNLNNGFTTTELGRRAATAKQQEEVYDLALKDGKITKDERAVLTALRGIPPNTETTKLQIEILIKVGMVKRVKLSR